MKNKRKYTIIKGSRSYFDAELPQCSSMDKARSLSDLIEQHEAFRVGGQYSFIPAELLIVKNNNYQGITEAAHDRLGPLIEQLTVDSAEIFLHNPTQNLIEYLNDQYKRSLIEISFSEESRDIKREPDDFIENMRKLSEKIYGQTNALKSIYKTLWYLTSVRRERPYVVMLYGNSGLGKTEMVREISQLFFDGKCLEKHLSMFQGGEYTNYFFGDAHSRKGLAFDLLERESNLIFFDEIDKCSQNFYSVFYTLFDNVVFKDNTYDVDVSGTLIILTSNYQTESEIREKLGLPIYYRIDKMIHFEDFNSDTIYDITIREIKLRESEYAGKLDFDSIYNAVSHSISSTGENARTIKYKVQQVIEQLLFQEIEDKLSLNNKFDK